MEEHPRDNSGEFFTQYSINNCLEGAEDDGVWENRNTDYSLRTNSE